LGGFLHCRILLCLMPDLRCDQHDGQYQWVSVVRWLLAAVATSSSQQGVKVLSSIQLPVISIYLGQRLVPIPPVLCFISRSVCAGKACKERRECGFGLVCYRTSDKATSPESAFLGSGSRPFFPLPFLNQQPASAVPAIISHHPPSTIHHPQQQLIANLKSKSTQCIQQIRDPDREPTLCPAVSCFVLFAGWLFILLAVDTGTLSCLLSNN
jgi:hypothetical protein